MSINISVSLLRKAKGLYIDMDMNKFTDRQIKNITKQIRKQSISHGNAATNHIAKFIIDKFKVPHFNVSSHHIQWSDIPQDHEFYEVGLGMVSVARLSDSHSSWYKEQLDDAYVMLSTKTVRGSVGLYYMDDAIKEKLKQVSTINLPLSNEVNEFLQQLENREINTLTLPISE